MINNNMINDNNTISPIAALFKYELGYFLEMHFALEDYYDISFAHNYFHSYCAWNAEELEATDYFNGLDASLVGSFKVVVPVGDAEFDF